MHIKLLRDGVVIQASYKEGENKFYFSREESVYFNISGEGSVIQKSSRREECNLLYYFSIKKTIYTTYVIYFNHIVFSIYKDNY